jgi:homoserine kinase
MSTGFKVFAPATVSNVAVGYDILGFALDRPGDEIVIRPGSERGLKITRITGAQGKLPSDPTRNTAGVAALQLMKHLGEEDCPIEMEIHKKMPFGSGLGSSAASAVAGAMAINEFFKRPLQKRDLLPFAMAGEQVADGAYHADNVAPSLLGGIVFIRDNETLDVHRIPSPRGLYVVVVHPKVEILTRESRAILAADLSLKQHVQQTGNLGGLIIGLYQSDFDLIRRSLQDVVIEPQRAGLIPHFYDVQEAVMKAGALGCSISGAGPSIFALCNNTLVAEEVELAMQRIYQDAKIEATIYRSGINSEGAIKC